LVWFIQLQPLLRRNFLGFWASREGRPCVVVLIRACVAQKCVRDRQRESAVTAAPFFPVDPSHKTQNPWLGLSSSSSSSSQLVSSSLPSLDIDRFVKNFVFLCISWVFVYLRVSVFDFGLCVLVFDFGLCVF
jgi:hypothetical protein